MKSLQLLGILALSYLACLLASAQTSSGVSSAISNSTLTLTAVPAEQTDWIRCAFKSVDTVALGVNLQYHGQKPLRGFVAALYFREPGDQAAEHHAILAYQGTVIQPGAKWQQVICNLPSDAELEHVSFKVDFLAFEDKSFSGPMQLNIPFALWVV